MATRERPLGVDVIGGIFTVVGGFWSMITLIQIFDSIRLYGFASILVTSITSMIGFLLYGLTPLLFYSTGMNLFLSRPWARKSATAILPIITLIIILNLAFHTARVRSPIYNASLLDLLATDSSVFVNFLIRYFLIFCPIVIYFNHPNVVSHFKQQTD